MGFVLANKSIREMVSQCHSTFCITHCKQLGLILSVQSSESLMQEYVVDTQQLTYWSASTMTPLQNLFSLGTRCVLLSRRVIDLPREIRDHWYLVKIKYR